MSHKPDVETIAAQLAALPVASSDSSDALYSFLLADNGSIEQVQVELVSHPVALPESRVEALVADFTCEV